MGGNAFLVRYNGRPAIITNAHMFMNDDGTLADCSGRIEDGATYTPNIAWYDGNTSDVDKNFLFREVKLEFPPVNWLDVRATFQVAASQPTSEHDAVVFYLQEDISADKMPDGSRRGFLRASYTSDIQDQLYMLGTAPDIEKGLMLIYQKKCPGGQLDGVLIIGNTCDVLPGSSGSLLAVMEDGELRFRGIQSSALIEALNPGDAADVDMLNHATSSARLRQTGALD